MFQSTNPLPEPALSMAFHILFSRTKSDLLALLQLRKTMVLPRTEMKRTTVQEGGKSFQMGGGEQTGDKEG
jgi:hypothetical protein